jgi:preprotein translocase subunit YajC
LEGFFVQDLVPLLWIVAIAVVFWLLIIRPAQRRQKDMAQLQSSLSVGEQVVLTSGVFGTITQTVDTHLMVEIAPGVEIKVVRAAIGSVVRDTADEPELPTETRVADQRPDDEPEER